MDHRLVTRYEHCPLCGSAEIHLGRERSVSVERWKCDNCGEAFLPADSRREVDRVMHIPKRD